MTLFFCWGFTYALVVVGVVVERYSGVAVSLIIPACDRHRLVPSYQSILTSRAQHVPSYIQSSLVQTSVLHLSLLPHP